MSARSSPSPSLRASAPRKEGDDDARSGGTTRRAPGDDFQDDEIAKSDDASSPSSSDDDDARDEALAKWYGSVRKVERKVRRCRIAVLLFGSATIALSVVLIKTGFDSLDGAIKAAQSTLPDFIDIVDEANEATLEYLIECNETQDARSKLLTDIAEYCHLPEAGLYDGDHDAWELPRWRWRQEDHDRNNSHRRWSPALNLPFRPSYVDVDFGNVTVESAAIFLNDTLNNVTILYDAMEIVNDTLYNISGLLHTVDKAVDAVDDFWFYVAVGFIVALDVMVALFMIGVSLAWKERQFTLFRNAKDRCVLPIFCFVLFASYLICTYCLVASTGMSDFCIGTPDDQVLRILDARFPFTQYADWYFRGCHEEDEPLIWFVVFDALAVLAKFLNDFLLYLATVDASDLVDFCDFKEPNFLPGAVSILQQHVEDTIVLTVRIKRLLECTNVHPVYADLAYETVCRYAIRATAEISFYLFVMAICCMGIVTLRVAWYEIEEEDDDEKTGGRLLHRKKKRGEEESEVEEAEGGREEREEVVVVGAGKGTEPSADEDRGKVESVTSTTPSPSPSPNEFNDECL